MELVLLSDDLKIKKILDSVGQQESFNMEESQERSEWETDLKVLC